MGLFTGEASGDSLGGLVRVVGPSQTADSLAEPANLEARFDCISLGLNFFVVTPGYLILLSSSTDGSPANTRILGE